MCFHYIIRLKVHQIHYFLIPYIRKLQINIVISKLRNFTTENFDWSYPEVPLAIIYEGHGHYRIVLKLN